MTIRGWRLQWSTCTCVRSFNKLMSSYLCIIVHIHCYRLINMRRNYKVAFIWMSWDICCDISRVVRSIWYIHAYVLVKSKEQCLLQQSACGHTIAELADQWLISPIKCKHTMSTLRVWYLVEDHIEQKFPGFFSTLQYSHLHLLLQSNPSDNQCEHCPSLYIKYDKYMYRCIYYVRFWYDNMHVWSR